MRLLVALNVDSWLDQIVRRAERGKWVRPSAGNTMGQVGLTPDVTST